MYINKLHNKINKYNNTYHRTIKLKPVDVNPSIYIGFPKEIDKEGPKFKVGNAVIISKFKNIFAKGNVPNWSEEVLCRGHMLLVILTVKKLFEHFKEFQKEFNN